MIRFKRWYDLQAMTPEERRLYNVWRSMKARCTCPTNMNWKDYGGRGIKVCEAWMDDFSQFIKDVGFPPRPGLELDRHPNNDGNYEPGNVRWATRIENLMNVRSNRPITIDGVTKSMCQWADEYGIDRTTFFCRLKWGWEGAKLLTSPRTSTMVTINGVEKTAYRWAKESGMTTVGFLSRVRRGVTGVDLLKPSQKMKSGPRKKN